MAAKNNTPQTITIPHGDETHFSSQGPLDPRELTPENFYEQALARGISKHSARRWASAVIGKGIHNVETIRSESQILKTRAVHIATPPSLKLHDHVRSSVDQFQKLVFKTHDDLSIETVLIPLHKENADAFVSSFQWWLLSISLFLRGLIMF